MLSKVLARALALALLALLTSLPFASAQQKQDLAAYIRENYVRNDYRIPVRDGVRLYTVVYSPKDQKQKYPFLMRRTPYSVAPYDEKALPASLGPSAHFAREGYIFVYQDVRGCYMSEGTFDDMRPHRPKHETKDDTDESTDTYDTLEWLLKNVPNHNGKAGITGISYPGFYSSASMIDAHPSLKAVSPQAPIADWFFDDFHHHGALFLPHAFNFLSGFGQERPGPTTKRAGGFKHPGPDGYQFFLDLGSMKNVNDRHFKNKIRMWNDIVQHPNYDDYWQKRNILPHLKKVAPAVMTVGGWYDAEDLYGTFTTYQAVERQNPGIFNMLVVGPWAHGGWSRGKGDKLGNVFFGSDTSPFFQEKIELPFFNHFLKGKGEHGLPEAVAFETGRNRWIQFNNWPPRETQRIPLFFHAGGKLSIDPPNTEAPVFDEYVSDPARPVPYTEKVATGMTREYMTDDQRFASRRTDVLTYQTDILRDDVTLVGPLTAHLHVSTTGTDSDWVVKLIDVYPPDAQPDKGMPAGASMGGYQMMVRSEILRGRFRNSYEKPEAFQTGKPTEVKVPLQDVLHTFRKGHRIMVQVCSTWFPLADRNPQRFVPNIYLAQEGDFTKATQRVYRSRQLPTRLEVGIVALTAN